MEIEYFPAEYMSHGLEMIAVAVADKLDDDWLLTDDCGTDPYSNETFTMRSYEKGYSPNFSYEMPDGWGLHVVWNGDARHGVSSNRYLSKKEWNEVISACMESLDEW